MTRWIMMAHNLTRGMWFRAAAFTAAGVLLAILSSALGRIFPDRISIELGQNAVGTILQILASSMLAVTTFSLTAMVSAYSSASSLGTPRSTQLLISDHTSQNALSTFLGAFTFSIVGIISLSVNAYTDAGRTMLFVGTLLVITVVIATMLHWISFLTRFGRMSDIIDRAENAARHSMSEYAEAPLSGAQPWKPPVNGASPVCSDIQGVVTHVDMRALHRIAEENTCEIWVLVRPGSRCDECDEIALVSSPVSDVVGQAVQRAFVVQTHRDFLHDPRFGLTTLSEIASRALSQGINDPGTAIEVFGALERVLAVAMDARDRPEPTYARVFARDISPEDMLDDAFRASARDGAATLEVALRLQTELGRLLRRGNRQWSPAIRALAVDAFERSKASMTSEKDLRDLAQRHIDIMTPIAR